jgi:hypothetical protein
MYSSTGGHHSSLDVTLTGKQKRIAGTSTLADFWKVGFVEPEKVNSYVCKKCGPVSKQPKVELVIKGNVEQQGGLATYFCLQCKDPVALGMIPKRLLKEVNPEYIVFDETGEFRAPTVSDIDGALSRAEAAARERDDYQTHLQLAQNWAYQIDHQIPPPLIDELAATYHGAQVAYVGENLVNIIATVLEEPPILGMENGEVTGPAAEEYELLMSALPDLEIPDDALIRERLLEILRITETLRRDRATGLGVRSRELDGQVRNSLTDLESATNVRQQFELDYHTSEEQKP